MRDHHAETDRGHHGGRSDCPLNVALHGLSLPRTHVPVTLVENRRCAAPNAEFVLIAWGDATPTRPEREHPGMNRAGPRVDALEVALYALLCFVWGSTWLVIKVGYGGLGPFNVAGLRFLVAGCFLAARARPGRALAAGPGEWRWWRRRPGAVRRRLRPHLLGRAVSRKRPHGDPLRHAAAAHDRLRPCVPRRGTDHLAEARRHAARVPRRGGALRRSAAAGSVQGRADARHHRERLFRRGRERGGKRHGAGLHAAALNAPAMLVGGIALSWRPSPRATDFDCRATCRPGAPSATSRWPEA